MSQVKQVRFQARLKTFTQRLSRTVLVSGLQMNDANHAQRRQFNQLSEERQTTEDSVIQSRICRVFGGRQVFVIQPFCANYFRLSINV